MNQIICYIAQIAIPFWVVLSVVIVVKLIKDNAELGSRLADALKVTEDCIKNCRELSDTAHGLITIDRNEIAIFEQKEAEIEAIREKYEYRIQEVSEYLNSFAERVQKCCDAVSANVQKTNSIDKDIESCSKAIVLLKNEIDDMKKNGVTVWDVTASDWDPPVTTCDDGK